MNDNRRNDDHNEQQIEGLGLMVAAAAGIAIIAWCVPAFAALWHSREVLDLGLFSAIRAGVRLLGDGMWSDPAAAYPEPARSQLPGPVGWWLSTAALVAFLAAVAYWTVRRIEPAVATERLGRRPYDWRGSRPRPWARPRDLRRPRKEPTGFSLGRLDGRPIASDEEAHVAVIAPTRAGKTTRCVIPWLLEHDGPAIVTSTKRDVLDATRAKRERQGRIWVFDAFGAETTSWSPELGCDDWSHALRQAQWLADASSDGDSEVARYWRGEAAKLLAPLLHAAALDGRSIRDVLAWVDAQDTRPATKTLAGAGANAAELQLRAVAELDPRNRGTTYMSAGSVLAAYRYPELEHATGDAFTPERFIKSAGDTLFLVAAERHQRLLAPMLVSLLSAVIHEAIETNTFANGTRRLRVLLDEAANVAPLPDMPRMLSQAAGHGIRIATVWQSLGQMRERYNRGADTILANSTTKLLLGPITDDATRDYALGLSGARRHAHDDHDHGLGSARALQQLTGERALLVSGARPPAVVTLRPYWRS